MISFQIRKVYEVSICSLRHESVSCPNSKFSYLYITFLRAAYSEKVTAGQERPQPKDKQKSGIPEVCFAIIDDL